MELPPQTNRDQIFMTSLDMMVEQDSLVRLIDVFLDYMDTRDLPFTQHKSHTGRPAYPNRVLIGIYVYGYLNRVRSSRQLEKACQTNVELFWLNKNLKPCYKTIANFRKDNAKGFRKLFVEFRDFCKNINLYGREVIAVDGSKFRGQNSMKNNYNIRKINKHLDYIENQQKEYLESLDDNDVNEEKINKLNQRKAKYENLKQQLEQTDETQISTVDPDTRALPLHMRIVQVGYNLQSVVDGKHNLIVDYQVTNKNDHRALAPMALKAKQALGLSKDEPLTILADKGYHTGEQMQTCHDNNINTIVAIPRKPKKTDKTKPEHLRKESFIYDPESETYLCANNKKLTKQATYQRKDKKGNPSGKFDRYTIKYSICKNCKYLEECVSQSNQKRHHGRYIDRYHTDGAVVRNKEFVTENKDLYKRRQAIVEHPFGTIKRQWGYNHTLMKSIPKVQTEFSIITLCYNLRRAMSILSPSGLKKALESLFLTSLAVSALLKQLIVIRYYHLPQPSPSFSI
jgi:transposase